MVFIIDHTIKHILHKFPLLLHLLMLHVTPKSAGNEKKVLPAR